ncbi:hypothetical protein GUI37_08785 [Helcococcus kunzii]|uniref:hypothetical protein n=1 Tax=Helcococcus kunzii TaxID=40091 RepID=UPI001BAF1520|nr:hypothetical protein [Helcococcus kunzii]QUY65615.1 hypothetical protein GUI37_08785 [Helcococcus kunzii]
MKDVAERKLSSYYTISDALDSAIKPDTIKKIWGEDYLTVVIIGLKFNIYLLRMYLKNTNLHEY